MTNDFGGFAVAPHRTRLWLLPVAVGVLPVVFALLSAAIAMSVEVVPQCIPFVEGCTSISATGRYPPASYVFKGFFLPYSVALALFWYACARWLELAGAPRHARWVRISGVAACFALIVYVTLLGSRGEAYEFMRRFGIYLFFLFTVVAELAFALALERVRPALTRIARFQTGVCIAMVLGGLLNLALKQLLADPDPAENVIEWNFALIMFLNLCLVAPAWRATDYGLGLSLHR